MTAPSLAERIEAEIGQWPTTSSLNSVLREAAELARRFEGAPVVQDVTGKYGFVGRRVRLVLDEGGGDGDEDR